MGPIFVSLDNVMDMYKTCPSVVQRQTADFAFVGSQN